MMYLLLITMVLAFAATVQGASKCYGDLGCYNSADFFDSIHTLPQSRSHVNVKFYLFTRSNSGDDSYNELVTGNSASLSASYFDGNRDTKFIVHGYTDHGKHPRFMTIKNALLQVGDFNVISVDWKDGADGSYDQAAANAWLVGGLIAEFISFLFAQSSVNTDKIHLIGESLGSHTTGYAGARHNNPKLARITAVDPAGPLFHDTDASVRIDPTDAEFVDAIHTDGGNFVAGLLTSEGGFGTTNAVGHIDFYPNGGKGQPGCDANPIEEFITLLSGNIHYILCDHVRALELLTDSITASCDMKAFPCDNYDKFNDGDCRTCGNTVCGIMGFRADQAKPPAGQTMVKQYLKTASSAPFCKGHFRVTLKISSSSNKEYGNIDMTLKGNGGNLNVQIKDTTYKAGHTYNTKTQLSGGTLDFTGINQLDITFDHTAWWDIGGWFNVDKIKLDYVKVEEFDGTTLWFCGNGKTLEDGKKYTLAVASSC